MRPQHVESGIWSAARLALSSTEWASFVSPLPTASLADLAAIPSPPRSGRGVTEEGRRTVLPQPAPGWYDDPDGSGGERYWDGSGWTEYRRKASITPEAQSPSNLTSWQADGSNQIPQYPPPPPTHDFADSHLWPSATAPRHAPENWTKPLMALVLITVVSAIVGLVLILTGGRGTETTGTTGSSVRAERNESGPVSQVLGIHMPLGSSLQPGEEGYRGYEFWHIPPGGFSDSDLPIGQPVKGLPFCAVQELSEGSTGYYWSNHVEAIRIRAWPQGFAQIVRTQDEQFNGRLDRLALAQCP